MPLPVLGSLGYWRALEEQALFKLKALKDPQARESLEIQWEVIRNQLIALIDEEEEGTPPREISDWIDAARTEVDALTTLYTTPREEQDLEHSQRVHYHRTRLQLLRAIQDMALERLVGG